MAIDYQRTAFGSPPEVQRWTSSLKRAPFRAWRWPGADSRVFTAQDLTVIAGVNALHRDAVAAGTGWFIFAGGRSDDAFAPLDSLGASWSYEGRP